MNIPAMNVNGDSVDINTEPRRHLADFLREDLLLTGTHIGCEQGICGACTVVRDGRPIRACLTPAISCANSSVDSIEHFDDDAIMTRLRHAFSAEHALQCGFCTPGMLITARDIVIRYAGKPVSEQIIRVELSGNLCRCTGYSGIVRAIERVLAEDASDFAEANPSPLQALTFDELNSIAEAGTTQAGQGAVTRSEADGNGRRIESSFNLNHPAADVWHILRHDITTVVACLPGAELGNIDDDGNLDGFFNVKLGPISTRIAGEGKVTYDDDKQTGQIEGQGKDNRSNSQAKGSLSFTIDDNGDGSSHMAVALGFELTGALAQFSRGGLVDEIVRVLIDQFRSNFNAHMAGEEAPRAQSLGLLQLVSLALRQWLKRVFSRQG